MMELRVKMFALARELAGQEEVTLVLKPGSSVSDLIEELVRKYPGFLELKDVLRVAVNQEFARPGDTLRATDEVAIIPPLSGG